MDFEQLADNEEKLAIIKEILDDLKFIVEHDKKDKEKGA